MKGKLKEIILEGKYFEIVFLVFMMAISVPLIHPILGSYAKITVAWAGIVILYDILVTKRIFKVKYSKLIILFGIIWFVSVIVNYKYNFKLNFTYYLYGVIHIWLLYPKYSDGNREELSRFMKCFVGFTFVTSFISLIMFVVQYEAWYGTHMIGYYMGRLHGVYVSPNAGGIYAFISIVMSLLIWKNSEEILKRWERYLLVFNVFVQTSYISLTDSSGTQITYMVFVFVVVMGAFINKKVQRGWKNLSKSFVIGILSMIVCVGVVNGIGKVYSYIPSIVKIEQLELKDNEKKKPYAVAIEREYTDDAFAAGRVEIWKIGLQIIKENPILGVGHENVQREAQIVAPDNETITSKIKSGMHNVYMQSLVETGVVGGIVFLLFTFGSAVQLLKYFFDKKSKKELWTIIAIAFVAALAVNNLGEATILFCQSGIGVFFWLLLGNLLYKAKEVE